MDISDIPGAKAASPIKPYIRTQNQAEIIDLNAYHQQSISKE